MRGTDVFEVPSGLRFCHFTGHVLNTYLLLARYTWNSLRRQSRYGNEYGICLTFSLFQWFKTLVMANSFQMCLPHLKDKGGTEESLCLKFCSLSTKTARSISNSSQTLRWQEKCPSNGHVNGVAIQTLRGPVRLLLHCSQKCFALKTNWFRVALSLSGSNSFRGCY